MLRSAASTADRENHEKITNDILPDAAEDAREDARAQIKQKSLDSLTQHQRVVYDIVRDHGPLGPSKIHDRYTEAVDDPDEADCSPIFRRCLSTTSPRGGGHESRPRVFTHRFGSDLTDVVNC